jgi:lipoate-protein ligase A
MSDPVYPPATWRLLITSALDGATNMATDEAIVRAVTVGLVPPTLRLYAWEPPCLSLGRGQPGDEVDRDACARDGVDVVRRPTGGRAILHTDELTYCVVAPPDEPRLEGDIIASYRRLSRALLTAIQNLGVQAQSRIMKTAIPGSDSEGSAARTPNAVCFEVPSHYELTTADGRKLVGSAQMRTNEVVLQHGTLPLVGDIARICRYLMAAPDPERVRSRAATAESALGRPVTWDEAVEAMVMGFGSALNLNLAREGLTQQERTWVAEFRANRYANDSWTWRL